MMNWIKYNLLKVLLFYVLGIGHLDAQDSINIEVNYYKIIDVLKKQNEQINFEINKDTLKKYKIKGFFIFDLTDTLNYQSDSNFYKNDCSTILFKKNHIYHFAPTIYSESISNIMYIDKVGNRLFFEYLNCDDKGASIKEVLEKIKENIDEETQTRVLNYRKYGKYFSFDNYGLKARCK